MKKLFFRYLYFAVDKRIKLIIDTTMDEVGLKRLQTGGKLILGRTKLKVFNDDESMKAKR